MSFVYHLHIATLADKPTDLPADPYESWNWRVHLLNQTYLRPQRAANSVTSPINLVAVQFDQMLTPAFFLCYQAASAYSGKGAGGLATGKIGLGVQHTINFLNQHLQPFAEVFLGAGGGGGLALGGGSLVEAVLGLHYALTPTIGLITSISQLKAISDDLNTTVFTLGITINFATLTLGNGS